MQLNLVSKFRATRIVPGGLPKRCRAGFNSGSGIVLSRILRQLLTVMVFLFPAGEDAAAQGCAKYERAMSAGNGFLHKERPDYDSALLYFQVALVAARECRIGNEEAASRLKTVFEAIKAQRDEAVKAKQDVISASQKTRAALTRAEKLINAFYFYEDRFALSVKQVGSSRKYGFINKEGDVAIQYNFEYAEQFDYSGFAKVKKKDHWGEVGGGIFEYLIDTAGKEYLLSTEFPDPAEKSSASDSVFTLRYPKYDLYADALDFRNKKLAAFPATLGEFRKFQVLLLGGNHIQTLPRSIGNHRTLTVLDLSENGLENLPVEIENLENLRTLLLSKNNLLALPAGIGHLKKLEVLNLGANALSVLPSSIGQLTSLKKLVLRGNQITHFPAEIGRLQQLRILDLANLRLAVFPPELLQLANLEVLNLSGNEFRTFPDLKKLPRLHTLDISYMGLKTLPPEILQLKSLRTLHFYGNWVLKAGELTKLRKRLPHCQVIESPLYDVMEILND